VTATPVRVIQALVTLWDVALGEVLVHDGEPPAGADSSRMLVVGTDIDPDIDAIAGTATRNVGSLFGDMDVQCVLQGWSGDVAPGARATLRNDVFELFRLATEAVWATPGLDIPEIVSSAHVSSWSLRDLSDDQGALAQIVFLVHVDTY